MVLLVIDTQTQITKPDLYRYNEFVSNMKTLIRKAREHQIEVIYVRHDDGEGSELTKGSLGYEIYEGFKPFPEEKQYDKKVNSIFRDTDLLGYLKSIHETQLVITGLQTEYCINASILCGFEHGFQIIVPAYANTTSDNVCMSGKESYHYYNEHIWPNRYATCLTLEETLNMFASNGK